MPINDANFIKEKIIKFLEKNGASLPVHIAKDAGMDMIFTSAFLSELISHQKIKVSNMKVGTSPVYFIPGNEKGIEKFIDYLGGKEREALILLKNKKFLEDSKQEPAIKIALRTMKDFANPFEKNGKLIWRYFLEEEKDYEADLKKFPKEPKVKESIKEHENIEEETKREKPKDKPLQKKKPAKRETKAKKQNNQNDEKFFNKVKEFLSKNSIEILDVEDASKDNLILKIKINGREKLLVAYNKKKIDESDIIKAYKKSSELALEYIILSLGEPAKKMNEFIEAVKKLDGIKKIE